MFNVHDCIGFLTSRGAKVVCEAMNDQFKRENLTRVQWTALYYISQNGPMTQKDLADAMMISEPSAMHLVKRLEQAELIERGDDPDNYRVKLLRLTARGETMLQNLFPLAEQFNRAGTRNISSADLETFKRVMDQMVYNVQHLDEE